MQVEKVNKFTSKLVDEMRTGLKNLASRADKATTTTEKDELLKVLAAAAMHTRTAQGHPIL